MPTDLDRTLARALQQGSGNTITPSPQALLDTLAMATSPVPVAGDLAGLLADGTAMAKDPSWGNALAMALGAVPYVPSKSAIRAGKAAITSPKKDWKTIISKSLENDPYYRPDQLGRVVDYEGYCIGRLDSSSLRQTDATEWVVYDADGTDIEGFGRLKDAKEWILKRKSRAD